MDSTVCNRSQMTRRPSLDVEERKVGTHIRPPVWRLPEMRQTGRPIRAVEALAFLVSPLVLTGLSPLRQGGVGMAVLVCRFPTRVSNPHPRGLTCCPSDLQRGGGGVGNGDGGCWIV